MLDKSKKIKLKFADKPFGCIDSFIVDQDGNPIATMFRNTNMWGYALMFHLDKSIDPPQVSCVQEGMMVAIRLLRESGYDASIY